LIPLLQWYDYNDNPVINATIQSTDDQVSAYILIPAYFPSIKPFTFVASVPEYPADYYKYSWTSQEISVCKYMLYNSLNVIAYCVSYIQLYAVMFHRIGS